MMKKSQIIAVSKDDDLKELLRALRAMARKNDYIINNGKGKLNFRKTLVLGMYSAATHYAAAVETLNSKRPTAKVSNALLRPLFEVWGNLEYLTLREDDYYFLKAMYYSYHEYIDNQAKLEDFYTEHDVTEISGRHLNKLRSNQAKAEKNGVKFDEAINKIEQNEKTPHYRQTLYSRLVEVDRLRPQSQIEYSHVYNYHILYKRLSGDVHLGMDGIAKWFDFHGKNVTINNSGESIEDVKRAVWTAVALLKDVTVRSMHELDMYDEGFDKKYQLLIEKHLLI